MTPLLLGLVLLAADPAPPAAESTPVVKVESTPVRPWWRTLEDNPVFTRGIALGVVAAGSALLATGVGAFTVMAVLRAAPAPAGWDDVRHENTIAVTTLVAATGLVLGAMFTVGGLVGLVVG